MVVLNKLRKIILIFIIILISGCVKNSNSLQANNNTISIVKYEYGIGEFNQAIEVIHDNEYNVTCWYISGDRIGTVGFSCVPDTQLQ